jgi:hypothetical protein
VPTCTAILRADAEAEEAEEAGYRTCTAEGPSLVFGMPTGWVAARLLSALFVSRFTSLSTLLILAKYFLLEAMACIMTWEDLDVYLPSSIARLRRLL